MPPLVYVVRRGVKEAMEAKADRRGETGIWINAIGPLLRIIGMIEPASNLKLRASASRVLSGLPRLRSISSAGTWLDFPEPDGRWC
jgi:hypothetical protein